MKPGIKGASLAALAVLAGAAGYLLVVGPHLENPESQRLASPSPSPSPEPPREISAHSSAVAPAGPDPGQLAQGIDRALAARDGAQRETAFTSLLPELLRRAPGMALALYERQSPGDARDALRDELARQWIDLDGEAASAWIASLEGDERAAASVVAMRRLASKSPARALEFARRFDLSEDDGSLEHLVQIWATEDPTAASHWIDAQPRDAWSDRLRARIDDVRRQSRVSGI